MTRIGTLCAVASCAVVLVACGGGEEPPAEPAAPSTGGQQLFSSNCGNCHTLAAAGASGQMGPDLDQLQPGPDLVRTQTENGGGAMPAFKGRLSPDEIQAIGDYVAENAGRS